MQQRTLTLYGVTYYAIPHAVQDELERLRAQAASLESTVLTQDTAMVRLRAEVSMLRGQLEKDQALVTRLCDEVERMRWLLDRAGDTLPPCELYEEIQAALGGGEG